MGAAQDTHIRVNTVRTAVIAKSFSFFLLILITVPFLFRRFRRRLFIFIFHDHSPTVAAQYRA